MKLTFEDKMMVAAHRGDSYNYNENTMEAFEAAIEAGADMVETDVHLTKDGVLVLMHDHTVDRTSDGTGLISDYTYEELCRLNVGDAVKAQQIPTLEQLLQLLDESKVLLNLEIKEYWSEENKERCHACIDACIELVEQYQYADKMVFNSFDAYVLEYIEEKFPGKYMLHGFYPYAAMKNVTRNPDEYLYCACIWGNGEKKPLYEHLLSCGIEPWIGASVTQERKLVEHFQLGAKLVTTNFPADCLEKCKHGGIR